MRPTLLRPAFAATALAVLTLALVPAHAQWKWRDAQGRVQYSDRPPPHDVPDKNVLARPNASTGVALPAAPASAPAGAAAASAVPVRDAALEARKRQGEAEEQAQRRAEEEKLAKQRRENCERAREYARTLDSGIRIARVNAQGEREVLDDEQRAAEGAKARDVMSSECR